MKNLLFLDRCMTPFYQVVGFTFSFLGLFGLWIKNKNYKKIMKIMWKSEKISGRDEEDSKDS